MRAAAEVRSVGSCRQSTLDAEQARLKGKVRTAIHRLTRAEYENTMRDLFDMPGLALAGDLPADGSAHEFDENSDALDISHVNLRLCSQRAALYTSDDAQRLRV